MTVAPKESLKRSINRGESGHDITNAADNTDVKKIFFSKNEKFMVLITNDWAQVVEIRPNKMELIAGINL